VWNLDSSCAMREVSCATSFWTFESVPLSLDLSRRDCTTRTRSVLLGDEDDVDDVDVDVDVVVEATKSCSIRVSALNKIGDRSCII